MSSSNVISASDNQLINSYEAMTSTDPNWQTKLQGIVDPTVMSALQSYAQDTSLLNKDKFGAANTTSTAPVFAGSNNPAYIMAKMSGKSTAGIPQELVEGNVTPAMAAAANSGNYDLYNSLLQGAEKNAPKSYTPLPTASTTPAKASSVKTQLSNVAQSQKAATSGSATAQIDNLFSQYLGRTPAQGGLDYYTNLLNSGTPLSTIQSQIASSPEAQLYKTTGQSLTPAQASAFASYTPQQQQGFIANAQSSTPENYTPPQGLATNPTATPTGFDPGGKSFADLAAAVNNGTFESLAGAQSPAQLLASANYTGAAGNKDYTGSLDLSSGVLGGLAFDGQSIGQLGYSAGGSALGQTLLGSGYTNPGWTINGQPISAAQQNQLYNEIVANHGMGAAEGLALIASAVVGGGLAAQAGAGAGAGAGATAGAGSDLTGELLAGAQAGAAAGGAAGTAGLGEVAAGAAGAGEFAGGGMGLTGAGGIGSASSVAGAGAGAAGYGGVDAGLAAGAGAVGAGESSGLGGTGLESLVTGAGGGIDPIGGIGTGTITPLTTGSIESGGALSAGNILSGAIGDGSLPSSLGGSSLSSLLSGLTSGTGASSLLSTLGPLLSGYLQSSASKDAASVQQNMFNTTQANAAPYIAAGKTAAGQISAGTQPGGQYVVPAYKPFTMADFTQDPGYQFQLQQGQNALTNAASLSGGMNSNNLKGLIGYTQGMANTDYQQALNNYMSQYQQGAATTQQNYGNVANIAQMGANAGQGLGSQAAQVGANIGSNIVGAGAAQSAAVSGAATGYNNSQISAQNQALQQSYLQWLQSQGSGVTVGG